MNNSIQYFLENGIPGLEKIKKDFHLCGWIFQNKRNFRRTDLKVYSQIL
jgi:hypothetical protein